MKSLIVYYSYTGNTQKVAEALKGILSKKGEVDIFALEPEDESDSFFMQCVRAFRKKRASLKAMPPDVSGYDLICLGNPVWAFAPVPAMNTYIDSLKDLTGKEALCFITYGSGTGADRCLDTMDAELKKKGASKVGNFKVQQGEVKDRDLVEKKIRDKMPENMYNTG